jgi:hypothetical protein
MVASAVCLAAVFACPNLAKWLTEERCPDVEIVVFRHHPGQIDTKERMATRDRDEGAILKALKDRRIGYSYEGGLGSGYELSVHARDLGRWKSTIDKLINDGTLKYYERWGLDRRGYGLVPVR